MTSQVHSAHEGNAAPFPVYQEPTCTLHLDSRPIDVAVSGTFLATVDANLILTLWNLNRRVCFWRKRCSLADSLSVTSVKVRVSDSGLCTLRVLAKRPGASRLVRSWVYDSRSSREFLERQPQQSAASEDLIYPTSRGVLTWTPCSQTSTFGHAQVRSLKGSLRASYAFTPLLASPTRDNRMESVQRRVAERQLARVHTLRKELWVSYVDLANKRMWQRQFRFECLQQARVNAIAFDSDALLIDVHSQLHQLRFKGSRKLFEHHPSLTPRILTSATHIAVNSGDLGETTVYDRAKGSCKKFARATWTALCKDRLLRITSEPINSEETSHCLTLHRLGDCSEPQSATYWAGSKLVKFFVVGDELVMLAAAEEKIRIFSLDGSRSETEKSAVSAEDSFV